MQTYVSNLIPRLQQFSKKLDDTALLVGKHWVVIDEESQTKTIYIFRSTNDLLISKNGKVTKAKWEYVGNNSILIDISTNESYLFRHGFFDENVLALKIDNANEYAFLIDEKIHEKDLTFVKQIDTFLLTTYAAKLANVAKETPLKSLNQNTYNSSTKSSSANTNNYRLTEVVQTKVIKQLTKEDIEKRKKSERVREIFVNIWLFFLMLLCLSIAYLSFWGAFKAYPHELIFFWFLAPIGCVFFYFGTNMLVSFIRGKSFVR